jgi:hypothetical protein
MTKISDIRSELEKNPNIDNSRIDDLIEFYELMTKDYNEPIFKKDESK